MVNGFEAEDKVVDTQCVSAKGKVVLFCKESGETRYRIRVVILGILSRLTPHPRIRSPSLTKVRQVLLFGIDIRVTLHHRFWESGRRMDTALPRRTRKQNSIEGG